MTRSSSSVWLGAAVLLAGVLALANGLLLLEWVSLAAALVYTIVRFWVWRFAMGSPGAGLLLAASLAGLLALLLSLTANLVVVLWYAPAIAASHWAMSAGFALAPVSLMLLALGMLRSHLAPRWIAAVGASASVVSAVTLFGSGVMSPGTHILVRVFGLVLESLFLVAFGVLLVARSRREVAA